MIKFKNKKQSNKQKYIKEINLNNENIVNIFDTMFNNIDDLDVEYIINM